VKPQGSAAGTEPEKICYKGTVHEYRLQGINFTVKKIKEAFSEITIPIQNRNCYRKEKVCRLRSGSSFEMLHSNFFWVHSAQQGLLLFRFDVFPCIPSKNILFEYL